MDGDGCEKKKAKKLFFFGGTSWMQKAVCVCCVVPEWDGDTVLLLLCRFVRRQARIHLVH